jgi:hypothetical protein
MDPPKNPVRFSEDAPDDVRPTLFQKAITEPVGVGGWLAWLILALGVGLPISFFSEISNIASGAEDAAEFAGSLIALACMTAGSMYVAFGLLQRWPGAPTKALRFIVGLGVLGVAGVAMEIADGGNAAPNAGQILGLLVWAVAWVLYLRKSTRVRNTYVSFAVDRPTMRTTARVAAVALAALLMWIGSLAYSNAQRRFESQYAAINPYQWLKASRQMSPAAAADEFADGVMNRVRASMPRGTATPDGTSLFADLGSALRATVRYTAEMDRGTSDSVVVEAELRSYFHANGIATIESMCVPDLLQCPAMQKLFDDAETALLVPLRPASFDSSSSPASTAPAATRCRT